MVFWVARENRQISFKVDFKSFRKQKRFQQSESATSVTILTLSVIPNVCKTFGLKLSLKSKILFYKDNFQPLLKANTLVSLNIRLQNEVRAKCKLEKFEQESTAEITIH